MCVTDMSGMRSGSDFASHRPTGPRSEPRNHPTVTVFVSMMDRCTHCMEGQAMPYHVDNENDKPPLSHRSYMVLGGSLLAVVAMLIAVAIIVTNL